MAESKIQNFNHLKIHTQYSICEGAIKIDDLKVFSKENKIKSLGLCDTSNLCGALEFAEKISKSGTQPIIGTQINFKFADTIGLMPVFALNESGYKKIIELSSSSFLKNDQLSDPHLGIEEVKVNDDSSFIDDLGADSLDTVELVMAFEEEFGSEISDSEAEKILTVGDAIKFIESKSN